MDKVRDSKGTGKVECIIKYLYDKPDVLYTLFIKSLRESNQDHVANVLEAPASKYIPLMIIWIQSRRGYFEKITKRCEILRLGTNKKNHNLRPTFYQWFSLYATPCSEKLTNQIDTDLATMRRVTESDSVTPIIYIYICICMYIHVCVYEYRYILKC